jgi:FdhD protein
MTDAAVPVRSAKVTAQGTTAHARTIPAEVPVAFVYDGTTHAVMMASPTDLEDFAVGFSLAEGIIGAPQDMQGLDIVEHDKGIELRAWLVPDRGRKLAQRRRNLAGPTGCGLCGVESLEAAVPSCPHVSAEATVTAEDIAAAQAALERAQMLNRQTRAVHGAGFWTKADELVAVAEDVGRHNALDKLLGRLRRNSVRTADGIVLLTSRVSVEMVQKAAVAGAPVIVAMSAPTALALHTAEQAGITLVAVARADGFEVFTHPHRIAGVEAVQTGRKGLVHHAA